MDENAAICTPGALPRPRAFWGRTLRATAAGARILLRMEIAIRIQIEQLPEGPYLATSDELPGLVAQGRTIAEALEIARDVARKLIEARRERDGDFTLATASEHRDYTIVVAA